MLYDWSDKKILIVEDTYINYQLLKAFLDNTKARTVLARNSCDFFMLIDNEYDLVLMDVNLGENLNGIDLTKHMRKNGNYTPVIIQTANFHDYIIDDDVKHNGFISKPINFQLLFEMIDSIFKKNNG